MEGSYGLINNSLPKDAVQKVEVLENHQPVKFFRINFLRKMRRLMCSSKIYYHDRTRRNFSWRGAISLECKTFSDAFTQKYQWVLELQNQ